MRAHQVIADKLLRARERGSCLAAADDAEGAALRRRVSAGELVSPYRGLFVDAAYWNGLAAGDRMVHIARGLAGVHPDWTFAGPTAAAIYDFEHPWSSHRHGICIADTVNGSGATGRLHRVYMTSIPTTKAGGLRVTSVARTLIDCARMLTFAEALPVFDSVHAQERGREQALADDMRSIRASMRSDTSATDRLLRYTDPASENGGESAARAVMIEHGLPVPQLQRVFADPADPRNWYRVDFCWGFPGGYTVVAEFDGMAKYVDPGMTGRRSVKTVVNAQTRREQSLLRWGVSRIVRFDYDDVRLAKPLIDKLVGAGIPQGPRPW